VASHYKFGLNQGKKSDLRHQIDKPENAFLFRLGKLK
jgi:hypothetical protein